MTGTGSGQAQTKGLQLFPPPPKKQKNPSRIPSVRRNAAILQSLPQSAVERAESPSFGQTPFASSITPPSQAHIAAEIPRSHTSLSEAPTLVRNNSNASYNSMPKAGLGSTPPRGEEPVMRSIFPRYNPELPLEYQPYFPTQQSPTHIPKTIINRRPYSPSIHDRMSPSGPNIQSPMSIGSSAGRFPYGVQDESVLEPSSNEELRELWKVANGWRVSASEGRSFCLKMTSSVEEPVHTLSSSTDQPFYTLKIIPTSTSAQLSMTRQDPNKPPVSSSPPRITSSLSRSKDKDKDTDVLNTTLEEHTRRLPPNDGLVALLYPRAASNMALDMVSKPHRADGPSIIAAAEREAGRLVWDVDTSKYYLVHPALSTPFIITISSSPAWSRIEYTLEHPELPRNLVRLVRDGAGMGFLEVDTSAAARIDAFYIVDVAICAIMLVAVEEEKARHIEHFDAPPTPPLPTLLSSNSPRRSIFGVGRQGKKSLKVEQVEMDDMMDLESQSREFSLRKEGKVKGDKEEKVPGFCGLVWLLVKCLFWGVVLVCKGVGKVVGWVVRRGQKKGGGSR